MRTNVKKFSIFTIVFTALIICCMAFPSSAFALTSEDIEALAPSGAYCYYVDGNEDDQWVLTNGKWEHCDVVDSGGNLEAIIEYIRNGMLNREENISITIATKSEGYNEKLNTSAPDYDTQKNNYSKLYAEKLSDYIADNIFNIDLVSDRFEKAKSGDYLRKQLANQISIPSYGRLQASDFCDYSYYEFNFEIEYNTTAAMENKVDEFLAKWQTEFIDNNSVIQNPDLTENERNYYIVKTIYSFLADNTFYDTNVKENTNGEFGPETGQYKNSHSAYGALFGNTTDADGNVDVNKYDWTLAKDSMGLCKIAKYNQGLAVCDGYALVAYYLCQLNGIDCQIVEGNYTNGIYDPHAWNVIKLCDSDEKEYNAENAKWYYFDATFAATSPIGIQLNIGDGQQISIIDYSYFLRGTANRAFDAESHQQLYDYKEEENKYEKDKTDAIKRALDTNDYKFKSKTIDCSKAWSILTRRNDPNRYLEVENYFLVSPEDKYYKIDPDTLELVPCENDVAYNGNEYYYNINIQDFVNGVEYTCDDQILKDAQSCSFVAKSIDGTQELYRLDFDIAPLDMSKWDGYSSLLWNDEELKNSDINSRNAQVEFRGSSVTFTVEIYDVSSMLLTEGVHYSMTFKDANGNTIDAPVTPGKYFIEINFNIADDNYVGILKIPFEIVKGDLSQIGIEELNNITYGEDILAGCGSLAVDDITFYNGKDYTVSLENPNAVNYGNDGYIIYTALPTSEYFKDGTSIRCHYIIANQRNISNAFGGSTGSRFSYTGNEIRPTGFNLSYNGKQLIEGIDYYIAGYSNNINPGTGYITFQFIGNYCGTSVLSFEIVGNGTSGGNSSGGTSSGGNQNGSSSTGGSSSQLPSGGSSGSNTSGSNSSVNTFVPPAPQKVTGVKVKTTTSSVTLSWNNQANGICYEIYTYDSASKKWRLMAITSDNQFKATFAVKNNKKSKFAENTKYKYKIRAVSNYTLNGVMYNDYGSYTEISAVTKVSTPKSPKVKSSKKAMTVSWKKVTNATGYEIQYATDSKFKKNKKTVTIKKGTTTSSKIKNLESKKTYYVRVRAYQTVNGKKVYSSYTKTIKVKVK